MKGRLDDIARKIGELAFEEAERGNRVGILATEETADCYVKGQVICLGSRKKPETLAVNLFSALRKFDELGVDIVFAEWVEEKDEGLAVMNRMLRAAGFRVIN